MQEIFEKYIENSFDSHQQANFKFHQFELNYKKFFKKGVSLNTLDIGVGRGEMLSCMKKWGHNYHGIDISPSTVEFCKKLDLSCELVDDTEFWLNDHQKQFDIITCLVLAPTNSYSSKGMNNASYGLEPVFIIKCRNFLFPKRN